MIDAAETTLYSESAFGRTVNVSSLYGKVSAVGLVAEGHLRKDF